MRFSVMLITALLSIHTVCYAQLTSDTSAAVADTSWELEEHYSEAAISFLKETADSLNRSFLSPAAYSDYYSLPQSTATAVKLRVRRKDTTQLESMLKSGMTLQEIRQVFPGAVIGDTAHVLVAYGKEYIPFRGIYATALYTGNASGFETTYFYEPPAPSVTWVYERSDDKRSCVFNAWRLDRPFSQTKLPAEYAKMVQYVDGITDTSAPFMLYTQRAPNATNQAFDTLMQYVYNELLHRKKSDVYVYMYEQVIVPVQQAADKDAYLKMLLDKAVAEAIAKKLGDPLLEGLARGLYPPDTLLLLKRCRWQPSNCGADNSPELHAAAIATLAANIRQWPVFIKAHLNITFGTYDRMFDSLYSRAITGDYLHQLDILDISYQQLLPGVILRLSNMSKNHFEGDIDRMGCSYAMSAYANDLEAQLIRFINDSHLDPYNRCIFFMVYTRYCRWLNGPGPKQDKYAALKAQIDTYPDYIQPGISQLSAALGNP